MNNTMSSSFQHLKKSLFEPSTIAYPDPNDTYYLYTDTSKQSWIILLTVKCIHKDCTESFNVYHPITFLSGSFSVTQLEYPASVKEAFSIYISAHELSMYLEGAKTILCSDC